MHFNNNRMFRLAGFGIGLILTASLALASEGTFKLPFEAHFGSVTLTPGDYRISTPVAATSVGVVYLYGDGQVKVALPSTVGTQPESDRSYLELVNVGGTYFVRTYNAGAAGKVFTFGIPKKIRREALANSHPTSIGVTSATGN